ncbi:MAG: hypothetical protein HY341_00150 [Candidatus Kerfeldbacteria bacterium]|nr:hypothetical protein [Candidatus Kerfeldbacteria bacterium]
MHMSTETSILDRVQSARHSEERAQFNPSELVSQFLRFLTSKEESVVRRRFGLGSQQQIETLEEIGATFHVTRERIRQIENGAIRKLRDLKEFPVLMDHAQRLVTETLAEHGGAMEQRTLFQSVITEEHTSAFNERSLAFLMRELLQTKIVALPESDTLRAGWRLVVASTDLVEQIRAQAIAVFTNAGTPMPETELLAAIRKTPWYSANRGRVTDAHVLAAVALAKDVTRNPYDEYGLSSWGTVVPRRMSDKIYLVLKKHGKPMHFTKIADAINKIRFDRRKAYPPTVHNELILNDQYVLVGRGIYALREWGYKPGVVADVLADILRTAGHPLTRDELVEKVLEQRMVKRNTIHLALTNGARFTKMADGRYVVNDQHG